MLRYGRKQAGKLRQEQECVSVVVVGERLTIAEVHHSLVAVDTGGALNCKVPYSTPSSLFIWRSILGFHIYGRGEEEEENQHLKQFRFIYHLYCLILPQGGWGQQVCKNSVESWHYREVHSFQPITLIKPANHLILAMSWVETALLTTKTEVHILDAHKTFVAHQHFL